MSRKFTGIVALTLAAICIGLVVTIRSDRMAAGSSPDREKEPTLRDDFGDSPKPTQPTPLPCMSDIVESLRPTLRARQVYDSRRHLLPNIDVANIVAKIQDGEKIEALYPNRQSTDQSNRAFDQQVACIIYWFFNVRNRTPVEKQMAYINRQRDSLMCLFSAIVCSSLLPQSKPFFMEFLKTNFYPAYIFGAFECGKSFWGDPADCIDLAGIEAWPEASRGDIVAIARWSTDVEFKRKIAEALYNDPAPGIRVSVRAAVEAGKLPRPFTSADQPSRTSQ